MAQRDYYEVLGVNKDADATTLKKAYRTQAMKYHPDRNPNDGAAEKKFKEVNEAYDILKDDQKRAAYDRFGHAAFDESGNGNARGGAGFGGFSDIFEEMFGDFAGPKQGGKRQGGDLRVNVEIRLEDAFAGKEMEMRVPSSANCSNCQGSGASEGSKPVSCSTCGGRGVVRGQTGFFTVERTCPACQGEGEVISDPCRNCGGSGRVNKEKTLSVNIPAGVEDGTRMRISGEGQAGVRGAPAGDLYIFIAVKPHHLFQRDGADVHCRVPVNFTLAALGGHVEVPTVDTKRLRLSIPAGTSSGHHFRVRNKGMPVLRSSRKGDMYVEVYVETPQNLTTEQKELLRQFEEASKNSKTHQPESHSFFTKVKEFWDDLTD